MPVRDISLEKTVFLLSLAGLAFLYGYGSRAFGWFPTSLVERAWHQARAVVPIQFQKPDFVARRVHAWHGTKVMSPDEMQRGLTLIASNWKAFDWEPGLRLVGRKGEVEHEWHVAVEELFGGYEKYSNVKLSDQYVHGFHLYPDGDVVVNLDYVGMARLDACGGVEWRLAERTHHSLARADDGSFWVPVRRGEDPGISGIAGGVLHEHLLNVSEEGRVQEEIDILKVLFENGLGRFVEKFRTSGDHTHVNDVEPLSDTLAAEYPMFEAGDLLVSSKAANLVFVLDTESGRVKWHATGPFIRQHDPDFLGNGWIGVFDNNQDGTARGKLLGGSRIVGLQPGSDSTRILFPTPKSGPFYTGIGGKWQRLENGNMLLTEAMPGRLLEVTSGGRTVWGWVQKPYDESGVPHVLEGERVPLTPADIEAWSCSPRQSTGRETVSPPS